MVGESNYQKALWKASDANPGDVVDRRVTAVLVPEPHNQHDEYAVAVYVAGGGTVGYLSRDDAPDYQAAILRTKERIGPCNGVIRGGGYRSDGQQKFLGIWLDLADPEDVLRDDWEPEQSATYTGASGTR